MFKKVIESLFGSLKNDVSNVIEFEKSIQDNKIKAVELSKEFQPIIKRLEKDFKIMTHYCNICKGEKREDGLITLNRINNKLKNAKSEYYSELDKLRKSNTKLENNISSLLKKDQVSKMVGVYKEKDNLEKSFKNIEEKFEKGDISEDLYEQSLLNYIVKSELIELGKSYSKKEEDKIAKVMKEFKEGKLKTSSGEKVTSREQAIAIAMSEAGISKSEPTEAQKEAGNYKKDKIRARGFVISIENKKGSYRSGTDKEGKEWKVKMNNDYGYFNRTKGKDGDHVDVFVSPNPEEGKIFVIDQSDGEGKFDEHKVMMGFESEEDALKNYKANYEKGFDIKYSGITEVSEERLKKWLGVENGGKVKKNKPFSELKKSEVTIRIDALNKGLLDYDKIEKAHKYIRREGTPGNYKYIYDEGDVESSEELKIKKENKEDNNLRKKLLKHYFGSEYGEKSAKTVASMKYKTLGDIELRISDHSASAKNQSPNEVSIVTFRNDPTENKFMSSTGNNVGGKSLNEAIKIIDSELNKELYKYIKDVSIEDADELNNFFKTVESVSNETNLSESIIDKVIKNKLNNISIEDTNVFKVEDLLDEYSDLYSDELNINIKGIKKVSKDEEKEDVNKDKKINEIKNRLKEKGIKESEEKLAKNIFRGSAPKVGEPVKSEMVLIVLSNNIYKESINKSFQLTEDQFKKSETDTKEFLEEMISEHERLIKILGKFSESDTAVKKEFETQQKELEEYKEELNDLTDKGKKEDKKIQKSIQLLEDSFEKGLVSEDILIKARSGKYADNPVNRRLHRVGQPYGSKKQEDDKKGVKNVKEDESKQEIEGSLEEKAKEASGSALEVAAKEANDPEVRSAAHKELDRREKEEKVQEEGDGGEKPTKEDRKDSGEKEKDNNLDTKEKVEAEIKRLREIDTDDLDEISVISDEIQKLFEKRKKIGDKQSSERRVSFEEYREGFKSFSQSNNEELGEANDFYKKDQKSLKFSDDEEKSLSFYIDGSYDDIRDALTHPEDFEGDLDEYDKKLLSNIDNISNFISNNKIKENISLNRNVKGGGIEFFKGLNKGDIYEDKSFASTSLIEQKIFGDYNIEILAKKGSDVANAQNEGEYEYLIDKGSKFRVLDKTDTGMIVELL